MTVAPESPTESAHALQCMEIWGGTAATQRALSTPGLDAWIHARPFQNHDAGGDIHYVSMCGSGNISRFLVADVAGHGAPVADLARRFHRLMRRSINRVDSSKLARTLNDAFGHLAGDGRFATALIATYFAPTDQLVLVNAGHPRPLWYQAAQNRWMLLDCDCGECEAKAPRNLPLGIIPGTGYEQFAVSLQRDDLLLLYTDSIIEAADDDGRELGESGLLELVRGLDPHPPDRLPGHILDRVAAHRGGRPPQDDLTLVAIHHNAADPPIPSVRQVIRTMAKMVGLVDV